VLFTPDAAARAGIPVLTLDRVLCDHRADGDAHQDAEGAFSDNDSGFVIGVTRSSPDISFQAMLGLQQQLTDIVAG
jgi:hypothetical protein